MMKTSHLIEIEAQNESLYTFKILGNNVDDLQAEIAGLEQKSKQPLQNTPIVLQIENNDLQANELAVLMEVFSQNNISVAGIRVKKQELIDFAKFLGLSVFNPPLKAAKTAEEKPLQKAPKIIKDVVKSGAQVLSSVSDLVLLNTVEENAEIMSFGNILAYQDVQGKVFAGIYGDERASIFIQSFNVQIISIAGVYKKFDAPPPKLYQRCVLIDLIDGKLRFQIL